MTIPGMARAVLKKLLGPAKRRFQTRIFWACRHVLLATDLQAPVEPVSPRIPVAFRFGSLEDIERLDEHRHAYDEAAKALARRRITAGDRVMLGIHEGAVVFYAWLMYGQMDLDTERLLPTSPEKVYSYKVFTSPKQRGLKICPAYYGHIRRLLQQEGYRVLLCQVRSANEPSLKAHRQAGFTQVGQFWEIQAGGRVFYSVGRRLKRWMKTPRPDPTIQR